MINRITSSRDSLSKKSYKMSSNIYLGHCQKVEVVTKKFFKIQMFQKNLFNSESRVSPFLLLFQMKSLKFFAMTHFFLLGFLFYVHFINSPSNLSNYLQKKIKYFVEELVVPNAM